jgi:hypothetical protein
LLKASFGFFNKYFKKFPQPKNVSFDRQKGVNGNELFCLVNYQSVVFGPRRMLSYGPSLVWLKKLKSTKSYLLKTFW